MLRADNSTLYIFSDVFSLYVKVEKKIRNGFVYPENFPAHERRFVKIEFIHMQSKVR